MLRVRLLYRKLIRIKVIAHFSRVVIAVTARVQILAHKEPVSSFFSVKVKILRT